MHKSKAPPARIENQLLAALSTESYNRLLPVLETVSFALGDILYKPRRAIEYVYFPYKTIISIVNILAGDAKVEMAIIGSEGMLGTALISGNDKSPHQAIVQIGDSGMRMEAQAFRKEFRRNSELHDLVLYYSQALFVQVTQTAACNTLHPIIERLSRWLLMTQDRMASDTFYLTHDFIATMLGVRRGGVTIAAVALQKASIIAYHRGQIKILNRRRLEQSACECYGRIKRDTARLLNTYKNK